MRSGAVRGMVWDSPGLPLPASPLNPVVQGGGLRDASGFPSSGHAHLRLLETSVSV